jgi:protein SCO1/2
VNATAPDDQSFIRRLQGMAIAAVLLGLGIAAWAWWGPRNNASPLPVYGTVPAFTLTGSDRKPFDSAALAGKVWVASFVFTTCKNSCPMLGMQMKRLSASLPAGDGFGLISITVDPDKDTPAVLAKYAKDLGVEDPRWHFLTGKKAAIKTLVEGGFKLTASPGDKILDERGQPDILHSSKLVLVDKKGAIRGYYDGLLGASAPEIKRQALALAAE